MKNNLWLAVFGSACLLSIHIGAKFADAMVYNSGDCKQTWTCAGTVQGRYTVTCGGAFDTNTCALNFGTMYVCQGNNENNCSSRWSCNQIPPTYFACQGNDPNNNNRTCWACYCECSH
jgi:hypothetical protein